MKTEMLMPQMGESIAEATVVKWHKHIGDYVKRDETILEISTDKVDSEIPSPESGYLKEILAKEGEVVAVKSIIAIIDSEQEGAATTPKKEAPREVVEVFSPPQQAAPATEAPAQTPSSNKSYSPLVRNIASQNNVSESELDSIEGSGTHGRVTKEDLLHYIDSKSGSSTQQQAPQASAPQQAAPQAAPVPARIPEPASAPSSYGPGTKVEPFDSMRKAIAEHMVRSKHTSPHVYSVCEIDVTNIAKWRAREKSAFKAREGFNLSFTPFFLEAVVKGLTEYPSINASIEGDNLIVKRDINLGCAVALGEGGLGGLIVPNIKNAGSLNFTGIARGLNDVATRARSKKLKPDDVQGGTFTVTNVGVFGNILGYPIISQPQLAILALGAIKKRPVVIGDAIAIRDICYLTLAYDHRAIDGSLSGHFLKYVTDYLENWDMNRTP